MPAIKNPTPAPIVVPATGAPTCRGIALTVRDLSEWRRESDDWADGRGHVIGARARRALMECQVLCLRPTATRPACVGLTATAFAVASLQEDFAARALVVDPYDAEGNDIREALPMRVPFNPEIRPGERVCDMDGNEYGVVSTTHTGGIDVEYTTDLILRAVERMTFADLAASEAGCAAREDAAVAVVWEASEAT